MMKKHDLNIVIRSIDSLTPYVRNARRHSRKQLRKIADSIEKNGQTFPILIDEYGTILVGHARLEAAKLLGWTSIETRCLVGMTDAEKRAYILADNLLAQFPPGEIADTKRFLKKIIALTGGNILSIWNPAARN